MDELMKMTTLSHETKKGMVCERFFPLANDDFWKNVGYNGIRR